MCGRYTLKTPAGRLAEEFGVEHVFIDVPNPV